MAAPEAVEISGTMAAPAPAAAGGAAGVAVGSISSTEQSLYTLNEPVSTTVMRDLRRVGTKLRYVLVPTTPQAETLNELRDWDLWGPLLLCLVLSIIMSWSAPDGQKSLVFASVFVLVWAGAAVVTVNAQLLGGKLSFFQSVCVLGYCICPLVIAAILCAAWGNSLWRTLLVACALVWSTKASVVFLSDPVAESRRLLAVYPVILFYLVIGWMVYIQ